MRYDELETTLSTARSLAGRSLTGIGLRVCIVQEDEYGSEEHLPVFPSENNVQIDHKDYAFTFYDITDLLIETDGSETWVILCPSTSFDDIAIVPHALEQYYWGPGKPDDIGKKKIEWGLHWGLPVPHPFEHVHGGILAVTRMTDAKHRHAPESVHGLVLTGHTWTILAFGEGPETRVFVSESSVIPTENVCVWNTTYRAQRLAP